MNFQFDFTIDLSLAATISARIDDDLTGSSADRARRLYAENTGRLKHLAAATTLLTALRLAAGFAAAAVASFAAVSFFEADRFFNATRGFFQRQCHLDLDVAAAASPISASEDIAETTTASAAKHLTKGGENIFGRTELAAATFDAGETVTIVPSPFVTVAEHFIGFGGLFEALAGFFIAGVTVGMEFDRQFTVGLRDLTFR